MAWVAAVVRSDGRVGDRGDGAGERRGALRERPGSWFGGWKRNLGRICWPLVGHLLERILASQQKIAIEQGFCSFY